MTGQGGNVAVQAGSLKINGVNAPIDPSTELPARTGIINESGEPKYLNSHGNAGNLTVNVTGDLEITNQGVITGSTFTSGNGGDVIVDACSIELETNGEIEASTSSTGHGGDVNVTAQDITIFGAAISANSVSSPQGGPAGRISVQSDNLTLDNGGTISASAASASAGDITVSVQQDVTLADHSSISSSAGISGGDILVNVGNLLYVRDSSITATAGALRNGNGGSNGNAGNGGNIRLDPEFIVLNDSLISANAAAGQGGNILLEATYYFNSNSTLTATGATSGTVTIASPQLDLSGALIGLPSSPIDAESQLQETCAMAMKGDFSSFLALGKGDIEVEPDEAQGGSGDGDQDQRARPAHGKPSTRGQQ